ncbi:MAG: hypothetical protein GY906_38935 [bacterium]|nr:hypothetical protein [bacterium]
MIDVLHNLTASGTVPGMQDDIGMRVPRDIPGNLRYRKKILDAAFADPEIAKELWIACKRSLLFFVNTFVWTFDPRNTQGFGKEHPQIPFCSYPFQDETLWTLQHAIGNEDVGIEKSRDMGASWMCLLAFDHRWRFTDLQSFLIVSRIEDLVDKTGEPDCLFWKLDFIERWLPPFIKPRYARQKLTKVNIDNGSTITGASTTSETSRGGRKTSILFDEFAAVQDGHAMLSSSRDSTNSRIFNSTVKGQNAFYDIMQRVKNKITLHWSRHPKKALGIVNDENGRPTSPWYELQKERAAHPAEIAQELDIDYLGSDFVFFDADLLQTYAMKHVRKPVCQGEIEFERDSGQPTVWTEQRGGRLSIWTHFDQVGRPPTGEYVVGCDISSGTGSSNSCASIVNAETAEKVAEFVCPNSMPHEFANAVAAICSWFGDAYLVWEQNGPGRLFGMQIDKIGYTNIYYRETNEESRRRKMNKQLIPGWWSSKAGKLAMVGSYRKALANDDIVNPSRMAINECRNYVYTTGGTVEHSRSKNLIDPSGAAENHGDRVIADALAFFLAIEKRAPEDPDDAVFDREMPVSCFAARQKNARRNRMQEASW